MPSCDDGAQAQAPLEEALRVAESEGDAVAAGQAREHLTTLG